MKTVNCTNCNERYHSQVSCQIRCKCGSIVTITIGSIPVVNSSELLRNPVFHTKSQSPALNLTRKSTWLIDSSGWIIAIIGLILYYIISYHWNSIAKDTSATTSSPINTYQIPQSSIKPIRPISVTPIANGFANSEELSYDLCKVRIENSFEHVDKTGGFKARIDSVAKTLTLSYINNPKEVMTLINRGGGLSTWQLYKDGILQAEREMYRRPDLESNNEYVYSSRTEETKITIIYN